MNSFTEPRLELQNCMLRCAQLVDENPDLTVGIAYGHDLARAQSACKVTWIRDLRFQADIKPIRPLEDPLLLPHENLRIGVDPVRHPRFAGFGPFPPDQTCC